MNLMQLRTLFAQVGCHNLYAKPLAANDNSKNQVYFGSDFKALNLLPNEGVHLDRSPERPIYKARVNFGWLIETGSVCEAPNAQLILYPQYPEVRFSGFLQGCSNAPSKAMTSRLLGRVLFLGVTLNRQIVGYVASSESQVSNEFFALKLVAQSGVFVELPLPTVSREGDTASRLLTELRRIHEKGWIDSKQLSEDGSIKVCNAPQCGGFTLEAELGIPKNSRAEPDFFGWEVKQHSVSSFDNVEAGIITLMTPEPTGGVYRTEGVEPFIRKFGYRDLLGRPDRINFGGIYRLGKEAPRTGLTMHLSGFVAGSSRITDPGGSISLRSASGEVAAEWHFEGLLSHWTRKHAKAVYVPSKCREMPRRQYAYGHRIRLATQTDFLKFLEAVANGVVYYDPGIKLEGASTPQGRVKRRSQFRIASKDIRALYEQVQPVELV